MAGVPYTFANVTSNQPLLELDLNFATQITIGTGQVGLGNTMASLTNLTSIQIAGGDVVTALSTNGSGLTVSDASGAGLSITTTTGLWTQVGKRIWAELTFTFPATADGSNVQLSVPSLLASNASAGGFFPVYYGGSSLLVGVMVPTTNNFQILNTTGSHVVNSTLSNATIRVLYNYATA